MTDKERERRRRYRQSAKRHAAQRRYEQSAKGKACLKRHRDKRIFIERNRCVGIAASADAARAINAHITRRKRESLARFADGEKAQGNPAGAVPAETAP